MLLQVEVEAEFEDLSAQLFEAQQKVHELTQSLTESDAKRCFLKEPDAMQRCSHVAVVLGPPGQVMIKLVPHLHATIHDAQCRRCLLSGLL